VRAGSNFQAQDPMRQHFGLGSSTQADEVRVVWPDGSMTTQRDVAMGRLIRIVQSQSTVKDRLSARLFSD
jgi:hypothetical protein